MKDAYENLSETIEATVAASVEVKRRFFSERAEDLKGAARAVSETFAANGKLLICGNGGSAADAQHIAGEFVNQFVRKGRRALPALALTTDGGVLTCIANDTDFERVFARQIEAFGAEGDALLLITTSGNSPNILAAANAGRDRGMKIIGMLGRDGGRVRELCDVALVVSASDTQRIQETHNLIGHILCQIVEQTLFNDEEQT